MDQFIDVLHNDVSIVKDLPTEFFWSTRDYYATGIRATRIKTAPLHASAEWYLENVLPVLQRSEYGLILIYLEPACVLLFVLVQSHCCLYYS